MIDLHTHILPGMDDGARDADESIKMLLQERAQGVDTVVLTPHFYWDRETPEQFLQRRAQAFEHLMLHIRSLADEEQQKLPRLLLGAEVAWHHELLHCEQIEKLCIGHTKNLLLELPFTAWTTQMIRQLYDLIGSRGVTPVIAHLERYMRLQRPTMIREILELDVPVQISADILCHPIVRGKALALLKHRQAHLLATDCHNMAGRAPEWEHALEIARRKLGDRRTEELLRFAWELTEE